MNPILAANPTIWISWYHVQIVAQSAQQPISLYQLDSEGGVKPGWLALTLPLLMPLSRIVRPSGNILIDGLQKYLAVKHRLT